MLVSMRMNTVGTTILAVLAEMSCRLKRSFMFRAGSSVARDGAPRWYRRRPRRATRLESGARSPPRVCRMSEEEGDRRPETVTVHAENLRERRHRRGGKREEAAFRAKVFVSRSPHQPAPYPDGVPSRLSIDISATRRLATSGLASHSSRFHRLMLTSPDERRRRLPAKRAFLRHFHPPRCAATCRLGSAAG
jgi:hypothetical protein